MDATRHMTLNSLLQSRAGANTSTHIVKNCSWLHVIEVTCCFRGAILHYGDFCMLPH